MKKAARPVSYTKYGDFSKDNTEFVIKRPDTPRPWINFLSNGDYGLCLSQTAGGYSYFKDPGYARLTRWEPVNWIKNTPGRMLYIHDRESKKYWSANHQPVNKSRHFECRHGLGYTEITSQNDNIEVVSTHYVPLKGLRDVWMVKMTNKSKKNRKLSAMPVLEWHVGAWEEELRLRNIVVLMNIGKYDKKNEVILASKHPVNNTPWPWTGYMASSLKVNSFDICYEKFMGRYRSYHNPIGVEKGALSNSETRGENLVGALEHRINLRPGQTKEFVIVVGAEEEQKAINANVKKYRNIDFAKKELESVKAHWQKLVLDNFIIETPDKRLNQFVNVWNKYQVIMNNHWGRSTAFYHEGWGEFGYRNTAQDAMGLLPIDAGFAKASLIKLAEHQRKNGQPLPGWSLIKGTNAGRPPSDFPIWLPMLLIRYIKETGDIKILDKKIKYYDGGSDTLYMHAVQATRFLQDIAKSKRGLPLMGTQDWNDAYDRVGIGGKGESVWLGMGLCFALKNLEELATYTGDQKLAQECVKRFKKESDIINKIAWDGNWYCYGYNDYGEPIGSKKNEEGSIPLNSQTWAIIAGVTKGERLKRVLKTIDKDLATPYGPALFKPAYTKYNSRIGRITAFAPGTKENGALFCHGGAFKIYADLLLHRGNNAYETFTQILPNAANKDIETYKTEPYVFAEYLIGQGNVNYGEGAWTWLTGTADWTLFSASEGVLGFYPEFDGFRIDPCIPKKWKKAKITRNFRGATYEVEISNPQGVEYGVKELLVDGEKVSKSLIKPHQDGKVHKIKVIMGRK